MFKLEIEIIKAISFYNIFNFPLTPLEVYKNLSIKTTLNDVLDALDELAKAGKLEKRDGYFFLPQDKNLAEERKSRFLISYKKLKRASLATRFFRRIPFVRFVGVCNSLGYFNTRDNSDIDFLIITKANKIWTVRFLTVFFLRLLKLRPKGEGDKNKLCLSFFVTDDALNLKHLALKDGDPYFYSWFSWIVPLYDDGVYAKFITENNWVREYLPNFIRQDIKYYSRQFSATKQIGWGIMSLTRLENIFKFIQLRIMPRELISATRRDDGSVVINDKILKFHLLDRRAEYRDIFYRKIKNISN